MASIEERLKRLIQDHMSPTIADERIVPTAAFIDDLGTDSLDMVELVMAAEEEFGLEISDDDAEQLITIGDAVKFLERKTAPHSMSR